MLLLSTALAQTVTDVVWHGHGVTRPSERLVVDGQLFGLRVDGETAVLERYASTFGGLDLAEVSDSDEASPEA